MKLKISICDVIISKLGEIETGLQLEVTGRIREKKKAIFQLPFWYITYEY